MIRRLPFALILCACGGDDSQVSADATPDCRLDARAQAYVAGMRVAADDGVQIALVSALPAPPVRFENVWAVQIWNAQDEPMAGASLRVEPFMPDHGHGTPRPPAPVAGQETGSYDMGPFDLWMPGIWEMRFSVDHDDTTSLAVLTFCIEE